MTFTFSIITRNVFCLACCLALASSFTAVHHWNSQDDSSHRSIFTAPHCATTVATRIRLFQSTQQQQQQQPQQKDVQVFDNAFPTSACELLHDLAQEHYDRTNDGSSIFTRPPHNMEPLTPIEQAIHSALTELGDTARKVEYWSRDEYMNIDTHADIDEGMLEDGEGLRSPETGHVLYLIVEEGLKGPTCVFPTKNLGWTDDGDDDGTEMVVVPAVQGRILRFPGSAMHAVPKPATRWKHSPSEQRIFSKQDKDDCDEDVDDETTEDWDEDDDDYDDDDYEVERSVLLFNTWPDDAPPPRGVNPDYATGGLPDGMEVEDEDDAEAMKESELSRRLTEWEDNFGKDGAEVRCNSKEQWHTVEIDHVEEQEASTGTVHVSLMGNKKRRLHPQKYVELSGPVDALDVAMEAVETPSSFRLRL